MITALSVLVFWLLPRAIRPGFLALVSIAYLGYLETAGTCFLVAWSLIFFYAMRWSHASSSPLARRTVPVLIIGIFLYLGFFKYFPPFIETLSRGSIALQIALPLGISFYTFRLVHYAIESGRGNLEKHTLQTFLSYITLYSIFTAGPIERFDHFQQNREERWSVQMLVEGGMRIIYGLIKYFVLIDLIVRWPLGGAVEAANLVPILENVEPIKIWVWLFLKFIEAYLDFSAYSDIAIGVSRLFGFRIAENFNWPILARSILDFWTRWHMTLVTWVRTYIYMPVIGLTRNPVIAIFLTFVTIGLWHSASLHWLSWGAYHAAGVITFTLWSRRAKRKKWKWPQHPFAGYAGIPLTLAFVSGGAAFTVTADEGLPYIQAIRLLCKALCIPMP